MSITSETSTFPNVLAASSLMPSGREPYMFVRKALEVEPGTSVRRMKVAGAIRVLADAQQRGEVDPPLTPAIEHAVLAASEFIDDRGQLINGYDHGAAELILDAVFEHGYRNPGDLSE